MITFYILFLLLNVSCIYPINVLNSYIEKKYININQNKILKNNNFTILYKSIDKFKDNILNFKNIIYNKINVVYTYNTKNMFKEEFENEYNDIVECAKIFCNY